MLVLHVQHAHMPFEAFINTYNEIDIDCKVDGDWSSSERTEMYSKRLVEAYFLYILLEYKERYLLEIPMTTNIDECLENSCLQVSQQLRKFPNIS